MTSQIIYCQCGELATAGRYCLPCLNDETAGISNEELEAAASILDRIIEPKTNPDNTE